ncbi:MAG TPA: PAC2 family protein [Dehalococcoidia bacterium]|nr:PAC2 family protein [Dehalococcoidia bacterium]
MIEIEFDHSPNLQEPIAVLAFEGWNDAASAATSAARYLIGQTKATKFATLPAEEFFDFKSTRPSVKIRPSGERQVNWPTLEFYSAEGSTKGCDLLVGVGTEPSVRWRTFALEIANLLGEFDVKLTITLGALLADSPHTRPVRITGSAPDPGTATKLGLAPSSYEGPTGIVGIVSDALRQRGLATASLWANCPHYVSASQNPPATAALVSRLGALIGADFHVDELEEASRRFVKGVDSAMAQYPDIAAYVEQLESAIDLAQSEGPDDLPIPSDKLLGEIERFLRDKRSEDD